ncbi:Hsp20/alpha crystallin family protein [Pusillimonas sp. ANT_WB101]|uniref:Hsp20/alpha crystallin family protein n=1 Tax=Pusillimonas sp. ANT_WB101 TaxID=2597356 RepID=UPI0011ED7741|nr:Hsp20/alpha crystallin family protein [Pusillimonas sp. ANT_WB101]KAA0892996.1 Hsp20/alpha crystallin family protein [Pusillimonas sp. ANT_WB101]
MANNLIRFNPFGDLARFDALRDFDDLFKGFRHAGSLAADGAPRLNIEVSENEQSYTVKADVPGAKKEDVKVTVDGNTVSIRVETRRESQQKDGDTLLHSERYYGVQSRSFVLAQDIDDAKAEAHYTDGVLALTLPKKASNSGAKVLQIS